MRDPGPISFVVAPWGRAYVPETENAVNLANRAQKAFRFRFRAETVPLDNNQYTLTNGALDLRKAVGDLLRHESFRRLTSAQLMLETPEPDSAQGSADQLILVTSEADSDEDSARDYEGKELVEQCYFYHDSPLDERLPFAKNISIVSTYIWDHLPAIPEVPTTNASSGSGRRALAPYLFLSFGMIALSRCIDALPHHMETRGCPFDYCDTVQQIDRFFQGGRLCEDCESFLETERQDGKVTAAQLDSVKKLWLMARGREYEYDIAISFAKPERQLALQLAAMIRKTGLKVFYDNYYAEDMLGKKVPDFLDEVFRKTSRFCVIFASHAYEQREWPKFEVESAKARALQERGGDYIVPIVVEDGVVEEGPLSDLLKNTFRLSLATHSLEQIAEILIGKLRRP